MIHVAAVAVDIAVPGNQLANGEGVIVSNGNAVASVILLDSIYLARWWETQLRPRFWKSHTISCQAVDVQECMCRYVVGYADGIASVSGFNRCKYPGRMR